MFCHLRYYEKLSNLKINSLQNRMYLNVTSPIGTFKYNISTFTWYNERNIHVVSLYAIINHVQILSVIIGPWMEEKNQF